MIIFDNKEFGGFEDDRQHGIRIGLEMHKRCERVATSGARLCATVVE